jgi:hypothetical protein
MFPLTKQIEINIGCSTKFRSLDVQMSSNMARNMLLPMSVMYVV